LLRRKAEFPPTNLPSDNVIVCDNFFEDTIAEQVM
jgi:hypothetical protein